MLLSTPRRSSYARAVAKNLMSTAVGIEERILWYPFDGGSVLEGGKGGGLKFGGKGPAPARQSNVLVLCGRAPYSGREPSRTPQTVIVLPVSRNLRH